jgi:hypothetical protein
VIFGTEFPVTFNLLNIFPYIEQIQSCKNMLSAEVHIDVAIKIQTKRKVDECI